MRNLSNEERFNKIFNDSKNLMQEVIDQKEGNKNTNYDTIINLIKEVQKNQFSLFELAKTCDEKEDDMVLEIPSFISRH